MKRPIFLSELFLLNTLFVTGSFAQDHIKPKDYDFYNLPSPQVWSMMKYGNSDVDLYTGNARFSIPLYSYSDSDFDIPVLLSYSSGGYMPNVQTGPFGMGWYLNTAGAITREVRGIPDESLQSSMLHSSYGWNHPAGGGDMIQVNGYAALHLGNPQNLVTDVAYRDEPLEEYMTVYRVYPTAVYYETEPDIFQFNFLGHSGKFILQPNGQVKVYDTGGPAGEYKITVNANFSVFKITDGDGYIHTFNTTETSMATDESDVFTSVSWLLNKIEAPNGNKVTFSYNDGGFSHTLQPHYSKYKYIRIAWTPYEAYTINRPSVVDDQVRVSKRMTNLLTSINFNDCVRMDFQYGTKPSESIYRSSIPYYELHGQKSLASFKVVNLLDNSKTIKEGRMEYLETSGSKVCFLDEVYLAGEGTYKMEYFDTNKTFPPLDTNAIDWWGFYNGKSNNQSLMPSYSLNYYGNAELYPTYTARDPDFISSRMGMLKKVTYPTGGTTDFDYEQHSFSKSTLPNSGNLYYPGVIRSESGLAGGVRIKYMRDSGLNTNMNRRFYYKDADGSESGTLLWKPAFYYSYKTYNQIWRHLEREVLSTAQSFPYKYNRTHIEYSCVQESTEDLNIEWIFKSYSTGTGDDVSSTTLETYNNLDFHVEKQTFDLTMLKLPPFSREAMRGKVAQKNYIRTVNGKTELFYSEQYQYLNESHNVVSIPMFIHDKAYTVNHNISTPYLTQVIKKDYVYGEPFTTLESYNHNSYGQIAQKNTNTGMITTTRYTYLADIIPVTSHVINMKEKNLLKYPIEVEHYVTTTEGETKLAGSETYDYAAFHDLYKLSTLTKTSMTIPGDESSGRETYVDVYVTQYDSKGNILEMQDKAGIYSCFVWGYKGRHLLASVGNCRLSQLTSISGLSGIMTTPLTGGLSLQARTAIQSLPGSEAVLYEYKPNIGISRIDDPSGRKELFEYDQYGRLVRIRDDGSNPVKEYTYKTLTF